MSALPSAIPAAKVKRYLERLSGSFQLEGPEVAGYAVKLLRLIEAARTQSIQDFNLEALYTYRVPVLDPDGCSRMDGTLEAKPFDLREVMGIANSDNGNGLRTKPETKQLYLLNTVVEQVHSDLNINWLGFYQKRQIGGEGGGSALVKLAYRGVESRAVFPLTAEFARLSNNTTVGMTGKGIIINDIERYLWEEGGPYYQCDGKVLSEACLPVLSAAGDEVIGIIDAESYETNRFSTRELTLLVGTCIALDGVLAPVPK